MVSADRVRPNGVRTLMHNRAPTTRRRLGAADIFEVGRAVRSPPAVGHATCANGSCSASGSGSWVRATSALAWEATFVVPRSSTLCRDS